MPLSKKRNRDRMRIIRLHKLVEDVPVQPISSVSSTKVTANTIWQPKHDADGYPIYEE